MKVKEITIGIYAIFSFCLNHQNLNAQEIQKVYYSNGNLRSEFEITKDSIPNGECSIYHENGKLMGHGSFNNGKWFGVWEFYNSDGKIDDTGAHQNGLRDGKWFSYQYPDEGGVIITESNYKDGLLYGEMIVKNGEKLIRKDIFKEGIIVESTEYSDRIYESLFAEVELIDILNFDSTILQKYFDLNTWKLLTQRSDDESTLYMDFKTEKHIFYDNEGVPTSGKTIYLNSFGQIIKIFSYDLSTSVLEKSKKNLVENGSFYTSGALCTPPDAIKGKKEYFLNNGKLFLKYEVKLDDLGMGLIAISSPFDFFYPSGKLFKTGQFTCCDEPSPNKTGYWIEYDEKGKILSKIKY